MHRYDIVTSSCNGSVPHSMEAARMGAEVLAGLVERRDDSATAPDNWDEEEDGVWEAPMIPAQDGTALLAAIIGRGGGNASGLFDAYSFSASAQV